MRKFILGMMLYISIKSFAQQLPNPRPCRVNDLQNEEILFLALGNPNFETIKQGDFDINKDEVKLTGKSLLANYYKDNLKVNFFKPIDKSVFKHSVSGWCSWYYYYQLLDYKESIVNIDWISKNLKDYQLEYIQIDDAWQDKGKGNEDNRDWTNINERFKKPGMDSLARYIKNAGLKPALWIVPHGQSNVEVAKKSKTFMIDKNDKSEITGSWNWVGNYQLDPTSKNMEPYLKNLFSDFKFSKGYSYFKIDGQSLIFPDYIKNTKFFDNPTMPAITAYRNTLKAIRNTVGNETYLLGCWRTPIEGIGYFNATRSNGDVWASNTGFRQVLEAVRAGY